MISRRNFSTVVVLGSVINAFVEEVGGRSLAQFEPSQEIGSLSAKLHISIYHANLRYVDSLFEASFPLESLQVFEGKLVLQWLHFIELWRDECADNEGFFNSPQTLALSLAFKNQKECWESLRDAFLQHFGIGEKTTLVMWTYVYNAFTMGGELNTPQGFEIQLKDYPELHLGHDYYGYAVTSPRNGKTCIVEKESGAIIGASLEETIADIAGGEPEYMRKQLEKAMKQSVRIIPEEKFWDLYRGE
jgi:hypothetical protein